jgi:hypothetical protein
MDLTYEVGLMRQNLLLIPFLFYSSQGHSGKLMQSYKRLTCFPGIVSLKNFLHFASLILSLYFSGISIG